MGVDVVVKQYGIQRSGTNYIRQLLLDNVYDVRIFENQYGWKHGLPLNKTKLDEWARKKHRRILTKEDDVHPIIIIKNPYSWYLSIKKWYGQKFNFENSYKRYNNLYKAYKKLYFDGHEIFGSAYIITYENLLKNPKQEINKLTKKFGGQLNKKFIEPKNVPHSQTFSENRRKFYLVNDNFDLNKNMIKKITNAVNWDIINFYGYKKKI